MLNNILNVATLPLNIVFGDKKENLKNTENLLDSIASDTDVVVLPELFSTGYANDINAMTDLAEPLSGHTVEQLHYWAKKYNVAIAGSFLASTANRIYNRGFFIEPSGDEIFYDKYHLFSIGSESKIISKGVTTMPIIRFRGWNIALAVCYDLRFPVWLRNKNNAYDLLLIPANWPQVREYAWQHLLIARAIENQAYVVGANRGGEDSFGAYDNLSQIYDFRGYEIGTASENTPVISAILSKEKLNKFRDGFPVSRDADYYEIDLSNRSI